MTEHTRSFLADVPDYIQASAYKIAEAGPDAIGDIQATPHKIAEAGQDAIDDIQASAHTIAEAGQEVITEIVQYIQHYDETPHWMRVDPYIRRGYRPEKNSFRDCFFSLFHIHNESVNIWSHLVPGLFYLMFSLGLCPRWLYSDINVPTADRFFYQVYILCTASCKLSLIYILMAFTP